MSNAFFEVLEQRWLLSVDPVVNAGGPYVLTAGGSLTLDGSAVKSATSGSIKTWSWDLNGDGTFGDATGRSPTLTRQQLQNLGVDTNAAFTATLRVGFAKTSKTASVEVKASIATVIAVRFDGAGNSYVLYETRVGGESMSTPEQRTAYLGKLAGDGSIIWTRELGSLATGQMKLDANGNAYITAFAGSSFGNATILRVSAGGQISWTKPLDTGARFVEVASDGDLVVAGSVGGLSLFGTGTTKLRRYNPDGSMVWSKSFSGTFSALALTGGDDVLISRVVNSGTSYSYTLAKHGSADGAKVYSKTANGWAWSVASGPNGEMFALLVTNTSGKLQKLNANGSASWSATTDATAGLLMSRDDGSVILARSNYVRKYSAAGNEMWATATSGVSAWTQIMEANNGDIWLIGANAAAGVPKPNVAQRIGAGGGVLGTTTSAAALGVKESGDVFVASTAVTGEMMLSRRSSNAKPTIGKIVANRGWVREAGDYSTMIFTALNVADDASIARMVVYRDSNGDGVLQPNGDDLQVNDIDGSNGWAMVVNGADLEMGENQLFIAAQDNEGRWSTVTKRTVTLLPPAAVLTLSSNSKAEVGRRFRISASWWGGLSTTKLDKVFWTRGGTEYALNVVSGTISGASGSGDLVVEIPSNMPLMERRIYVRLVDSTGAQSLASRKVTFRDTTAPTVTAVSASTTIDGMNPAKVVVTYEDNYRMDPASFDAGDLQIVGVDNGRTFRATSVSVKKVVADGTIYRVTYLISPRDVGWRKSDAGAYQVQLNAGQVADLTGLFVADGTIGTTTLKSPTVSASKITASAMTPMFANGQTIASELFGEGGLL